MMVDNKTLISLFMKHMHDTNHQNINELISNLVAIDSCKFRLGSDNYDFFTRQGTSGSVQSSHCG